MINLPEPLEKYDRKNESETRTQVALAFDTLANELPFRVLRASKTWDPASVADNAVTAVNVDVLGARPGNPVVVGFTGHTATTDVIFSGSVDANDRVRVELLNKHGVAQDLPSGTVNVLVFQLR